MQIQLAEPFQPLFAPHRYKGAHGGRGSGKSHNFAAALVIEAARRPLRVVAGREIQKSIKDSVKTLLADKIEACGLGEGYTILDQEIRHRNGSNISFIGLGTLTSDQIKSLEGVDVLWMEEAQTISARSLEIVKPTIRKAGSEIWASWNPRSPTDPIDMLLRGDELPARSWVRQINYDENPWFTAELEEERSYDYRNNRHRYGHIWMGDYEPMVKGAIWDRETLRRLRVQTAPEMKRIVVAIDPAVSSEEGSNEHGVIVAGLGTDGHGYIIEDATLRGGPRQWAERAITMLDKHEADRIVVEINQGGDMVKHTLMSVRPALPISEVRATRGKHVRAEPIAALYSMGTVHHVGTFPELEDQLCKITAGGYEGEDGTSPDRADALVWALTDLFDALVPRRKAEPARKRPISANGWMS